MTELSEVCGTALSRSKRLKYTATGNIVHQAGNITVLFEIVLFEISCSSMLG
jgi:hypothetical protein